MELNRRKLLKVAAASLAGSYSIARAQVCSEETPRQAEGPFYPVLPQADKDNNLIQVRGRSQEAQGQRVHIYGKVMDESCQPLKGARIEIWQACSSGKYNHPGDPNPAPLDPDFQYWGIADTNEYGEYEFFTIKPGAYPAGSGWVRPPHIHFKTSMLGYAELTSQLYFAGDPLNNSDRILQSLTVDEQSRVVVSIEASEGENTARAEFNIYLKKIGR